ncbi:MAG TPA: hypothetical protein VFQ45_12270 [Longimicrobium sp.]|nr:hypothetical protein [Longimicrobium sp.]
MARLTGEQFAVLLLGLLAMAAVLGLRGMERLADARTRHFQALARQAAVSPLPYGALIPAAGRPRPEGVHAVVRADAVARADEEALCVLARHTAASRDVAWVALSGRGPACAMVAAPVRPAGASADSLRRLAGAARWWIVGADGRALYSRREVPRPAELRRLLDALKGADEETMPVLAP